MTDSERSRRLWHKPGTCLAASSVVGTLPSHWRWQSVLWGGHDRTIGGLIEDEAAFRMFFDNATDRQVKVFGTILRDEHREQFQVIQKFGNFIGTRLKRLETRLNDQRLQHQESSLLLYGHDGISPKSNVTSDKGQPRATRITVIGGCVRGQTFAPDTARVQRNSSAFDFRGIDSRADNKESNGRSHSPSSAPAESRIIAGIVACPTSSAALARRTPSMMRYVVPSTWKYTTASVQLPPYVQH